VGKAYEAVKLVKEQGIKAAGSFMIGNIGETRETVIKTIDMAKRLDLDTVSFMITTPYPGTEMYKMVLEKGYLRKDVEWADYAPVSNELPVFDLPDLTAQEMIDLRKKANREFYMRPKYIVKKLKDIRSIEDVRNIIGGAKLYFRVS